MFDPGYNAGYQPHREVPSKEKKYIKNEEIDIFNLYMLHAGKGKISDVSFTINEELIYVNYIYKEKQKLWVDNISYKMKALLIGSIVNGISYIDYTKQINEYFSSKESVTYFGCKYNGECTKLIDNREKTIANYFKLRKTHY